VQVEALPVLVLVVVVSGEMPARVITVLQVQVVPEAPALCALFGVLAAHTHQLIQVMCDESVY
jgi:hypothetical protein